MGHYYGYMRISTEEERGKQRFTRQENALQKYAIDNGISYLLLFKEDKSGKSFTGRNDWNTLESILQPGDTVVIKDISRFIRDTEAGYTKYMELMNRGIELIFIDNMTVSTSYIKNLLNVANSQNIVVRTSLESIVKLLLIVELDRAEQERLIIVQRIKDGINASEKKSGRKPGQLDKMSEELRTDIDKLIADRNVKYIDIMRKHNISRNTLKKYVDICNEVNE